MFDKLKDLFSDEKAAPASLLFDQNGKPVEEALWVACAVLLVEMARADKSIAPKEGEAVVALMSSQFGIDEGEMPKLIQIAMTARKAQGKLDEFIKCVNERFNPDQKQKLLAMIWKVVIADGAVDKYEERLAVQMKFRLQLTDQQAAGARRMAETGKF